ncbi:MAG: IS91 family transposase [Gammaproteobacteria bacterium]
MDEASGLQTVFHRFLGTYRLGHPLTPDQAKACRHIGQCRTEALGGLQQRCDRCGYEQPQYHSCRDRHCPKCQGRAQREWCAKQTESMLPVTYYHLVFTLPHALNRWVALHPEVLYRLLFQSVWGTLSTFGRDPKRLDGTLGMTCVLHSWGQTLCRHVHLHCLVPGGALSDAGNWHAAKSNYLFPVRALSRHFRGKMVSALRKAAKNGELHRVTRAGEIDTLLDRLMQTEWVVYTKNWLRKPETVIDYLGRYSRKIALTDRRILGIEDDEVRITYKDYRDHDRYKVLPLSGEELIRRFLLHILPQGFMRIRHFGFLANRCRKANLARIRASLEEAGASKPAESESKMPQTFDPSAPGCPRCHQGRLIAIHEIIPKRTAYG